MIRTLHGRGYRFLAPVQALPATGGASSAVPPLPAPGDAAAPAGRAAALARLGRWFDLAVQGRRRRLVFVTGEAGIGKTTLVEAFAAMVADGRAGRVARGQCLEQRGTPEPYLPVFDALQRLGRDDPEALRLLSALAPTWLAQLPSLVAEADRAALERRALGGTQGRMLREAAEALEAIARDRPLLLLLEDLHWADPSTVDLLGWLARRDLPARLLVAGTYRPGDAAAAPIGDAAAELGLRGLAEELVLAELDAAAVADVLARRLPGAEVPAELARLVHRRTDGVPLFVVQLAQAWAESGDLSMAGGRWRLAGPDGAGPDVPDDLRRLLELQLRRLDPDDLAMLEAAAVGGVEFAAATAAVGGPAGVETVEGRCAALARQGRLLRATGPVAWPDGTVSAGFRFAHDLQRAVLYERIPAGRRVRLHAAVGERLERAYGPAAAGHAAELAAQFLAGHDHPRAVAYLQAAAMQALGRSAHREAIAHLEALRAALPRLREGAGRDQAELVALMTVGPALIATRGFASPEVEAAYDRARALATALDRPRGCRWCCTAWPPWPSSAAATTCRRRCSPRCCASATTSWPSTPMSCWPARPSTRGRWPARSGTPSRGCASTTRSATAPTWPPTASTRPSPATTGRRWPCGSWAAPTAPWPTPARPGTWPRPTPTASPAPRSSWPTCTTTGTSRPRPCAGPSGPRSPPASTGSRSGPPRRTSSAAGPRPPPAGTAAASAGSAAGWPPTWPPGPSSTTPSTWACSGHALGAAGDGGGLAAVEEAIALAGTARPFYYLPELHRLRGDLLAAGGDPGAAAEAYGRAMELAAAYGARSPELRAALRLCLLPPGARPEHAPGRLRQLYDRFEEGFATPDLRAAARLSEAAGTR